MPRIVPLSELIHPFLAVTVAKPEPRPCTRCKELGFDPPHPVWDEAAGLCLCHSKRQDKAEEFKKAIDAMVKAGNCNFRGFVFPPGFVFPVGPLKDADFTEATFQGYAVFAGATFQGDADFWRATFQGYAWFGGVTFDKKRTTFQGDADFWRATFQEDAVFSGGTFKEKADFSFAEFSKRSGATTDFSEARFEGAADFRGGWLKEDGEEKQYELFSKESETRFLRVSFERPELAYFYRVNLSRCRFLDTDLKSVNFIGITEWHEKGWRNALYDEDHRDSKERLPELIELYRQLKQNYEERRDWEMANHFHYGQMEMQRKDKERPWRERILLNIYRVLSGYGVRFDWTLWWLVGLTLAFALAYAFFESDFPSWRALGWGMELSVKMTTVVQREAAADLSLPWWLTTLNSLTGASLIALLILALRRRFRF